VLYKKIMRQQSTVSGKNKLHVQVCRAPARLKFSLATVIGNVKEIFALTTEVILGNFVVIFTNFVPWPTLAGALI
jgi:hypothetical protein